MPIFNEHKAIFIHIPKCAGTSITDTLDRQNNFKKFINYKDFSLRLMTGRNLQHSTYSRIKALHPFKFNSYFKFSFVRNPFDRMHSEYHWRRKWDRTIENKSFEEMLQEIPTFRNRREPHFKQQTDFIYTKRNKLMVDFVGRFETLEQDFRNVATELGVKQADLKVLNRSRSSTSYRSGYSDQAQELIKQFFAKDLDLLEYEY